MKQIELYDGKHTITFDPKKHSYRMVETGEYLTNASAANKVLNKPQLVPWAARMGVEKFAALIEPGECYDELDLEEAAEKAMEGYRSASGSAQKVGSLAHEWIEKHINYQIEDAGAALSMQKMPVNPMIRQSVALFLEWEQENQPEWIWAERIVFHDENLHIGTADGLCHIPGNERPVLVDFKTGKGVWMEAGIQAASYALCVQQEFPQKYPRIDRCILHIPSRGRKYTAWTEQVIHGKLTGGTVEQDYQVFLSLLHVHNWIMNGPNKWQWLKNR